jgi:hypothetical protein
LGGDNIAAMTRSTLLAMAALPAALLSGAGETQAARPLLAELLARASVDAGQPAMSPLALEACLRQARELDRDRRHRPARRRRHVPAKPDRRRTADAEWL